METQKILDKLQDFDLTGNFHRTRSRTHIHTHKNGTSQGRLPSFPACLYVGHVSGLSVHVRATGGKPISSCIQDCESALPFNSQR